MPLFTVTHAGRKTRPPAAWPRPLTRAALLALTLLALTGAARAQAGASSYHYAPPPGWTQAMDGDIETLTPASEPAGNAQLMLLAPKAAAGEFRAQFEAERAALESFWALRAPQAVPLQSGRATVAGMPMEYAAHFASYDSDAGPRFMGFLALGDGRRFALLVFVAASHDSFNRLAPQAVEVFRALSFAR
ncbi:MAG: hypothetical protein MUC68_18270 [Burkholderiaceae bacterium]|jgi:hypothetical protein|nr:hypothetical protein [Burkholderiaceae bacterium]